MRYNPMLLTFVVMMAFAANSVLCRMALGGGMMDASSFTAIRLISGAWMLSVLMCLQSGCYRKNIAVLLQAGSWRGAGYLSVYAMGFSVAYVSINTATGALILFGAVQLTMMVAALLSGERPCRVAWAGYALAVSGLILLLWPGAATPSILGSVLMVVAGVAWGMYSLLGRAAAKPLWQTAGNFMRTVPIVVCVLWWVWPDLHGTVEGALLAVASGALASGMGYALWYRVVGEIGTTHAAAVQLSVPLLAATGGSLWMQEPLTSTLIVTAAMILGGIALVITHSQEKVYPKVRAE